MRVRIVAAVAAFAIAGVVGYALTARRPDVRAGTVTVYYVENDGATLARFDETLGSARDRRSVAFYAAVQAVVGPGPDVGAVRFPNGTIVRGVRVAGSTADVDLAGAIGGGQSGSLAESAEFKSLVWTLTDLPGITAVQVLVDGARVPTLPGGHLELDEPLTRQSF